MRGKRGAGINVGGASILVIFIILCLTTFATLSLVSANADLRLTEKAAKATTEYYAADTRAEETLALIDAMLQDRRLLAAGPEAYASAVIGGLPSAAPNVSVEPPGDGFLTVHFSEPINENQELAVTLRIPTDPAGSGSRLVRTGWQVRNTDEWQPEQEGLDLWSGEGGLPLAGGGPPLPIE